MRTGHAPDSRDVTQTVGNYIFSTAAASGRVPQADAIAHALGTSTDDVRNALKQLAAAKAIILAPNDGDIWVAAPFCAVPSAFRVRANDRTYWGICIWDALGVVAALHARDATISTQCADCNEAIELQVKDRALQQSSAVIHFAVPARDWWKNIGFT